jgi:hypothetical protein
MKRDFDLVRKILLDIQDMPANAQPSSIDYPGEYDQAVVNAHISLLIDAGLIEGKVIRTMQGVAQATARGLTWQGHDFIDAAKQDVIWKKAFDTIKDKGGAVTFEVLKELLKSLTLKAVGLS